MQVLHRSYLNSFWMTGLGAGCLSGLLVASLFLSGCAALKPGGASAADELERARQYIEQGNFEKAYFHLNQALTANPSDPDVHLNLGWVYLYTNEPEHASQELARVFKLRPDYGEGLHLKGAIYSYWEQDKEALKYYDKALKEAGETSQLRFHIANSLNRLNDNKKALKEYEKALALASENVNKTPYLFSICSVYYKLKEFDNARTHCEKALETSTEPEEKQRITDFLNSMALLEGEPDDLEEGKTEGKLKKSN